METKITRAEAEERLLFAGIDTQILDVLFPPAAQASDAPEGGTDGDGDGDGDGSESGAPDHKKP